MKIQKKILAMERARATELCRSGHNFRNWDLKVAPRILQAQLGHADAAFTLNVYTPVIPESQRRAIESLDGLLFQSVPKPERERRVQ